MQINIYYIDPSSQLRVEVQVRPSIEIGLELRFECSKLGYSSFDLRSIDLVCTLSANPTIYCICL